MGLQNLKAAVLSNRVQLVLAALPTYADGGRLFLVVNLYAEN